RMGELLRLWMTETEPERSSVAQALAGLQISKVSLDPIRRSIDISAVAALSLDAIAKGYIVDAALNAACQASPGIQGSAMGIGGDIRWWGRAPDARGWRIGIPDPIAPSENAPLVDALLLNDNAIATSGRGPRDYIGRKHRSMTISPFTGRPVRNVVSASVVA